MVDINKNNILWVEKYRPSNISKIVQQNEIKQLISCNDLSDLPHLLFYGPSGTGKTSTALAICRCIYCSNPKHSNIYKKIINERVLELNASDERGIKVVREKIKFFACQALNNYEGIPNYKLIILDEADVMTNDSQFALRRIMEQYSNNTRFILICNYITKIISPLSSRCSKYRFNIIKNDEMKKIITSILKNENIFFDENYIDNIIELLNSYSCGDLRKAITLLQRVVYVSNLNDEPLSCDLIIDVAGIISNDTILNLYSILKDKNSTHDLIAKTVTNILNDAYSASDVLNNISTILMSDKNITDIKKSQIFIKMSDISSLLATGSGDYIQLLAMCSYINHVLNNST